MIARVSIYCGHARRLIAAMQRVLLLPCNTAYCGLATQRNRTHSSALGRVRREPTLFDRLISGRNFDHILTGQNFDHILTCKNFDHILTGQNLYHILSDQNFDRLINRFRTARSSRRATGCGPDRAAAAPPVPPEPAQQGPLRPCNMFRRETGAEVSEGNRRFRRETGGFGGKTEVSEGNRRFRKETGDFGGKPEENRFLSEGCPSVFPFFLRFPSLWSPPYLRFSSSFLPLFPISSTFSPSVCIPLVFGGGGAGPPTQKAPQTVETLLRRERNTLL